MPSEQGDDVIQFYALQVRITLLLLIVVVVVLFWLLLVWLATNLASMVLTLLLPRQKLASFYLSKSSLNKPNLQLDRYLSRF